MTCVYLHNHTSIRKCSFLDNVFFYAFSIALGQSTKQIHYFRINSKHFRELDRMINVFPSQMDHHA